jgi:hypothetical protein
LKKSRWDGFIMQHFKPIMKKKNDLPPHFYSLPQGERRIRRMPPHPDPLPQVEREEGGRKEFNGTPHFGSLPQGERRERRKDFKKTPHPDPLPQSGEGT